MARVVLLQPRVGEWDTFRTSPAPPLGLLHAAALVAPRHETVLIDQRLDDDWRSTLRRSVGPETLCVGVSAYTGPMILNALGMCEEVRSITEAPIVWGGVHSSLMPEQTLSDPRVDLVVQGEGEHPFLALVEALEAGRAPEGIPGVWIKKEGRAVPPPPNRLMDPASIPEPADSLIDYARYLPRYQGRTTLYFQASRGCPLPCIFCYNVDFNGRRLRKIPPERVLARLRGLVERYRPQDVYFVDDNFIVDIRWASKIMEGVRDLGVNWQAQGVEVTTIRRLTDDQLRLMASSRLKRISTGVESGSPRIRALLKKPGTPEDYLAAVRKLAPTGITLYLSFMGGVPTETPDDVRETVRLIFRLLEANPHVRISPLYNATPYPGTDLYDLAIRNGYRPPDSLERWGRLAGFEAAKLPGGEGDRARARFYESLYFVSMFLDDKGKDYQVPRLVGWLIGLYRPLARMRLRRLNFSLLLERSLAVAAQRLWGLLRWAAAPPERKGYAASEAFLPDLTSRRL